jgi:hypothetical protein
VLGGDIAQGQGAAEVTLPMVARSAPRQA